MTGAELATIANEAAISAARRASRLVTREDFQVEPTTGRRQCTNLSQGPVFLRSLCSAAESPTFSTISGYCSVYSGCCLCEETVWIPGTPHARWEPCSQPDAVASPVEGMAAVVSLVRIRCNVRISDMPSTPRRDFRTVFTPFIQRGMRLSRFAGGMRGLFLRSGTTRDSRKAVGH